MLFTAVRVAATPPRLLLRLARSVRTFSSTACVWAMRSAPVSPAGAADIPTQQYEALNIYNI
eukprot:COSAG02_NODE_254_length_26937_cov_16.503950_3_plen_62_part_00